ncbi:MAG: hypothetical protein ACLR2E_21690 [Lachnospiraceae bacterium]
MTDLPAIDVAEKNGRWYYYFTVHSLLREGSFRCLRAASFGVHYAAEIRLDAADGPCIGVV